MHLERVVVSMDCLLACYDRRYKQMSSSSSSSSIQQMTHTNPYKLLKLCDAFTIYICILYIINSINNDDDA